MRYRIIAPALRHRPEYRRLSRPAPNARTLLEWLMTGDCTIIVPGLFVAGRRSIMEQLGWDEHDDTVLRQVWQEVLDAGLVRYDAETRLVWLPFMTEDIYLPDQPNVLKSWAAPWAELPDCDLKHEAWDAFRVAFLTRTPRHRDRAEGDAPRTTAFGPMFLAQCPEPRCARAQARSEAHIEPPVEPRTHPLAASSHGGSHPPSPRGSLQDQDQQQDRSADRARAELYRRLFVLWGPCRGVLHADFVPCTPQPHAEVPGELMEPNNRYWLDVLKKYNPTDAQLATAAEFLAARMHWQDKAGQGVTLNFLLKPPGQNFSDLLANAEAWRAGGKVKPQAPSAAPLRRRGHMPSSAPAKGDVPTEADMRGYLDGQGDGQG